GSNDSATIVITPAASLTKVTGGTFPFDGSAHAAGVLVTGAGSLSLTPSPSYSGGCSAAPIHVAQTTPTACTASYSFAGDGDHTGSNDSATIVITPAASLTKVTGGTFPFDGSAHAAGVLVTGAGSLSLTPSPSYSGGCSAAPIHVAQTTPTACTASYSFAGDGDHTGSNDSATIVITPAASLTKVTGGTFPFDGSAHAAGVLVTGAGSLSLTPSPSYSGGCSAAPIHVAQTTPTACTASYSFAGDGDHTGSNDSATIVITPAASLTKVTGGTFPFDGSAHAAGVLVTGAGSLSLTPSPSYSGGCSAAPIHVAQTTPTACTASYSFAGDGDHTGSNDSATIVITPAASLTKVTGGTFPFDGSAHAAGVLVTGAGSLSLTPSPSYSGGCSAAPIHVAQTTPTACTASYSFAGDGDHTGSNDSATIVITPAASLTKVTGGTFPFDGSAHAASVLVTGAGSLSLTPSPSYSGGCRAAPIHVAQTTPTACTASYSFAGDGDHTGSNDSATIVITPAASLTTVSGGGSFVFDGSAHAASVLVTGAGSLSLTPSPSYSGGCSAAPIHVAQTTPTACTASYSFAGDGDHTGSNDSATIVITPAASLTKVTGGTFPFDGSAHAASVLVTGAGSLSLTPSPSYSGGCSAAP